MILTSSVLAIAGALLIFMLGDGPRLARGPQLVVRRMGGVLGAFKSDKLRAAALGYFGHMWELYTFWTLVPLIISTGLTGKLQRINVAGLAFLVIAIGALGCIVGGLWSRSVGSARVAASALARRGCAV